MQNKRAKTTLNDTLLTAVIGFVTLYLFFVGILKWNIRDFSFAEYICVFAISYVVGMVINKLSQLAFDGFMRNRHENLKAARKRLQEDLKGRSGKEINLDNGKEIEEDYVERYYFALEYGNSDIPILEVQVSFIRSMFFVILLGCVAVCGNGESFSIPAYCAIAGLLILDAIAVFYMSYIQKEIYFHVYEDNYYMRIARSCEDGNTGEDANNGAGMSNERLIKKLKVMALFSKTFICHLLLKAIVGFGTLYLIAHIIKFDISGFGFAEYVCFLALSYFVGVLICIIIMFIRKCINCVQKKKTGPSTQQENSTARNPDKSDGSEAQN